MAKTIGPMESIWEEMDKLYGTDDFERFGATETIPSGSLVLDDALGKWGLPTGRIVQFAGKESSGKTLMSLMTIREWQKKDPKNWALFIDAEFTFDPTWATQLGVDVNNKRLMVWPTNDGAKIFERLCGVPHKEAGKPKAKAGLLDIILKSGGAKGSGCGIIVLDSVAAIQPPQEMTSKSGKSNMALMARFLPPELRRITPLLAETGVVFIAINQVRTDPGKMYGNPETTPGGSAWKHYCSVMVHFARPENKDAKLFDENEEQIGHIVKSCVDKNKVAAPNRHCTFAVEYVKGVINPHAEIAELGVKYGVVSRPNNRTYVYKDFRWAGKDIYLDAIKDSLSGTENAGLAETMLKEIKEAKTNGFTPAVLEEETETPDVFTTFTEEEV